MNAMSNVNDINHLLGKTLVRCQYMKNSRVFDTESIEFECEDGTVYGLGHVTDCCESVCIESIDGDLADLVGAPLVLAEEYSVEDPPSTDDWTTYTFYRLSTRKGHVVIRWVGQSVYYSVAVDFREFPGTRTRSIPASTC